METGFSTYGSEDTPWSFPAYEHTQDDQEIFINNALPIIRNKVYNQNVKNPGKEIILASWYELRGSDPTTWWRYVEENFGILHDNLTFKRGYDDLQTQIGMFFR
ncbi:MAG: hypothetical protein QMD21_07755 [Candidatus Thermoplasmatota archaeon]|nr:hypothetical protein [Candidatus Thermoplasmatota archaeon]